MNRKKTRLQGDCCKLKRIRRFIECATGHYKVDITVKEAVPDSNDGEFEGRINHMDPTHLALFVSEVASFSTEKELRFLLTNLTPGNLRLSSQEDFEGFRGFWLPFWCCLVNMHGAPLQACDYSFCENMKTYYDILKFRFRELGRHPGGEVGFAGWRNRALEPTTASNTVDPEIYKWLTDPNSPAGLTATGSLDCIEKYHGLLGEYLSSRVTPIAGTDKAQLLMVKHLPGPGRPLHNDKVRLKPTIRAEMEWRLFTQFSADA